MLAKLGDEHAQGVQRLPQVVAGHCHKAGLCEIREFELMRASSTLRLHRVRFLELGSHGTQHQARNGGADDEHYQQDEGLIQPRP